MDTTLPLDILLLILSKLNYRDAKQYSIICQKVYGESFTICRSIVEKQSGMKLHTFNEAEINRVFLATQPKNIYACKESTVIIDKVGNFLTNDINGKLICNPNLKNIVQVCNSIALDKDGIVYTLGVTTSKFNNLPKIKFITESQDDIIMIDIEGNVYAYGENIFGELGGDDKISIPTKISGLQNIISATIGVTHTLFLDNDGNIFVLGDNQYHPLINNDSKERWESLKITDCAITMNQTYTTKNITPIIQISSGHGYYLLLDKYGDVFIFGRGHRLGFIMLAKTSDIEYISLAGYVVATHKNNTIEKIPTKIPNLQNIISISTNNCNSLVLDFNGNIYAFGANNKYFFKLNDTRLPVQIPKFLNVTQISCGFDHYLFVNKNQVYVLGNNNNKKLCVGNDKKYVQAPRKIFSFDTL